MHKMSIIVGLGLLIVIGIVLVVGMTFIVIRIGVKLSERGRQVIVDKRKAMPQEFVGAWKCVDEDRGETPQQHYRMITQEEGVFTIKRYAVIFTAKDNVLNSHDMIVCDPREAVYIDGALESGEKGNPCFSYMNTEGLLRDETGSYKKVADHVLSFDYFLKIMNASVDSMEGSAGTNEFVGTWLIDDEDSDATSVVGYMVIAPFKDNIYKADVYFVEARRTVLLWGRSFYEYKEYILQSGTGKKLMIDGQGRIAQDNWVGRKIDSDPWTYEQIVKGN